MLQANKQTYHPLVSIITVNYNNTAVTCELLASLQQISYPRFEVIVVDNASAEDPTREIINRFPTVNVNNDTEFTEGLIEGLLEVFATYPDAGVASPKFHYFFHKGTIEYAGYHSVDIFTGRNSMIGCREKDQGQYDAISSTPYAHGGAMMISREALDKVGLMPELYFLYYEEFDWCEQFRRQGYKIYYQYKSLIYHKESMTTGKNSPLKTYYITRNRILFMRRNVRLPARLVFILYFICFTVSPQNRGYSSESILESYLLERKKFTNNLIKRHVWNCWVY
jgi:GT2 family glycosyltransferase